MVNCKLCGKSFKNAQGLSGHMTFLHGVRKNTLSGELQEPATDEKVIKASTEQTGSATERQLRYIERVLGINEGAWEPGVMERALGLAEPLLRANELSKLNDQLAALTEQLSISAEVQRAELTAALELVEKLRVSHNDSKENVSKIFP